MSSELQLDVRHLNRWRRHLVNAYEVRQTWLQVKLWSMPERFKVVLDQALYKCSALPFIRINLTPLESRMISTALHGLQTRSSNENSVCPSVCPSVCLSVKRVLVTKLKKDLSRFFISYERSFSLVYWEEEWLVGCDPFYLKFWVNWPPLERNRRFSTDIPP